jgi:hypothetical protein
MFEEELSGNASRNRQEDIRTRRRKLKQEQLKEKNDGQKNQAQGLIVNNDKAAAAAAFKEAVPNPTFEFVRTRMVEELKANQEAESRYRLAEKEHQRVEREKEILGEEKEESVRSLQDVNSQPNFKRNYRKPSE